MGCSNYETDSTKISETSANKRLNITEPIKSRQQDAHTTKANEHELLNGRKANKSPNKTWTKKTDGWWSRKHIRYNTEKINAWSLIYRAGIKTLYPSILCTAWLCLASQTWCPTCTSSQFNRCSNDLVQKKRKQGFTYPPNISVFIKSTFFENLPAPLLDLLHNLLKWSIANLVYGHCCNS